MITKEYLDTLIQKDKEQGLFRCKREMFTNRELFDLEMKYIFEGNWIYLAHESQLPKVCLLYTS
ncbi:MAG TPA: benzoate 1,2-dioxygenase large subunit, partial [Thauera sp.]|nr:benzoate 1,2-dioxygenase large subunit [Thauera sp.]